MGERWGKIVSLLASQRGRALINACQMHLPDETSREYWRPSVQYHVTLLAPFPDSTESRAFNG